jgi:hypothetical protein
MQIRSFWACCLTAISLVGGSALAQEKAAAPSAQASGYDVARESTVVGTVISYTPTAKTAPLGAHVVIQTSSGNLDVHLGDARYLRANHFTINNGDTLRIIGENLSFSTGTQFVARIVQDGNTALQVRSIRGLPLSYAAPRTSKQGGVS